MLPPASGRCSQPPPVEKSPSAKSKEALKRRQFQSEAEQRQHFILSDYYVLLEIFQYLKVKDLVRAAKVCRMWRDVVVHPSLWKTVRMKGRCTITDWDGFAETLKKCGTQHLDLREMLIERKFAIDHHIWKKFVSVIPRLTSLVKLELCWCSTVVIDKVIRNCPQLEVFSVMSIECGFFLNLKSVGNLKRCRELKLHGNCTHGIWFEGDLSPLQTLTQLTHLSMTAIYGLDMKRIDILESLTNLETLELGQSHSEFPEDFGTRVLLKLHNLKRLSLQAAPFSSRCTLDILEGVSKLNNLSQLELVNFDVKNGFDKCLANCKNIKRLLIMPSNVSQSATSNNMVLGGVMELSNNLTHFVWGFGLMALSRTKYLMQQMNEPVTGDVILFPKSSPCLRLIEDIEEGDGLKGDDKVLPNMTSIGTLRLPQLQKLLLTALPKTRVEILKILFEDTWPQMISDSTAQ